MQQCVCGVSASLPKGANVGTCSWRIRRETCGIWGKSPRWKSLDSVQPSGAQADAV